MWVGPKGTRLEQVLLIGKGFLLLLSELVQAVVVPVVIHEFMVSLDAGLSDPLADIHELLAWRDDAAVDKVELGGQRLCHCQAENNQST